MSHALVTGATGLVGSHIVDRLIADGWRVRALVREPSSALAAQGVEQVRGDVLDLESFTRAAAGVDVVFHTAAAVTPKGGWEEYRRPNVDGTSNAIEATARAKARLVHLSSVAVYGITGRYREDGRKTDEDTPFGALPEKAYYARSKRESEKLVMDAHSAGKVWATALRPDVIYGTRDRQFTPRIARLLSFGLVPLVGNGRSTFAVVHAANVADGAVRAAAHDAAGGRAYNLANDFDVTVRQFFTLGAQGMGKRVHFLSIPRAVAYSVWATGKFIATAATAGKLSVLSNASLEIISEDNPFTSERARRELGWSPPVHPDVGIPEAFRWAWTRR
ncbi:MAG TPA: NAD-dependent epimerase/dehydratase family protein [Gemmatimonadaceae bacterium]